MKAVTDAIYNAVIKRSTATTRFLSTIKERKGKNQQNLSMS
jgi:hypothetical protein